MKKIFILVLLLSFLALLSFWRVLFFDMWIDDAHLIWASLHDLSASHWYYNHPGLPLEFLFLSHLFGTKYFLWQIFGVLLKGSVSFCVGLFLYKLTNSKLTGILSAVFFAVSYAGLEVVDSPIMNIAGIVAIPMLLSLSALIDAIKSKTHPLWKFFIPLLLALLLDPGRMISIFLIIPLLFFLSQKSTRRIDVAKKLTKILLIFAVIGIPLFVVWLVHFEAKAQIVIGATGLLQNPAFFITKLNRVGNLLAAIGNIFIGLIYSMQQDFQDTGYYARIFGVSGLLVLLAGISSSLYFLKTKIKSFGITGFLLLWPLLWYLPNWFSEPRAPMAGPHRYVFLSSIGFICLIAYLLTKLKNKSWLIIFSLLFISLNILKSNEILAWQDTYRNKIVIDRIWNEVDKIVPTGETRDIFIFTGEQPWLSQSIQLFGVDRYMLRRGITKLSDAPLILNDEKQILSHLCDKKNPILLSHVYAWGVKSPGILENKSILKRNELKRLLPICIQ